MFSIFTFPLVEPPKTLKPGKLRCNGKAETESEQNGNSAKVDTLYNDAT